MCTALHVAKAVASYNLPEPTDVVTIRTALPGRLDTPVGELAREIIIAGILEQRGHQQSPAHTPNSGARPCASEGHVMQNW